MPAPALKFTPAQRVLTAAGFERVYSTGRRFGDALFSVNASPGAAPVARLGLSVGKRNIGNAVARNRVKRVVRDSFRLHQHELPPVDIVIGARQGARGAAGPRMRESLAGLWKKIANECAAPSRS